MTATLFRDMQREASDFPGPGGLGRAAGAAGLRSRRSRQQHLKNIQHQGGLDQDASSRSIFPWPHDVGPQCPEILSDRARRGAFDPAVTRDQDVRRASGRRRRRSCAGLPLDGGMPADPVDLVTRSHAACRTCPSRGRRRKSSRSLDVLEQLDFARPIRPSASRSIRTLRSELS